MSAAHDTIPCGTGRLATGDLGSVVYLRAYVWGGGGKVGEKREGEGRGGVSELYKGHEHDVDPVVWVV